MYHDFHWLSINDVIYKLFDWSKWTLPALSRMQGDLHRCCRPSANRPVHFHFSTSELAVMMTLVRKWSKNEFWIFFLKPSYNKMHVLSYGISHIHLKSCWLTHKSLEQNPFSTFILIHRITEKKDLAYICTQN